MLFVSEGSTVSPCVCCGLFLGIIMDNKTITNGQEDCFSNQVGKLLWYQTENPPALLSGNPVNSGGIHRALSRYQLQRITPNTHRIVY